MELDSKADVSLLLGRDAGELLATKVKTSQAPFVHHTALGWAVVGSLCPSSVNSSSGQFQVLRVSLDHDHYKVDPSFPKINTNVFHKLKDDEEMSLSVEDEKFHNLISTNTLINEAGHLEMPLPFKNVFSFPCNKEQVCRKQQGTLLRLKRVKHKFSESLAFM